MNRYIKVLYKVYVKPHSLICKAIKKDDGQRGRISVGKDGAILITPIPRVSINHFIKRNKIKIM